MNRMASLTARRRDARHARATAAVRHILHEARAEGIEIKLVGSLARGDFRLHSDVDLLVCGRADQKRRAAVERLVAASLRTAEIPYDLIFEDDLTQDRVRELLHAGRRLTPHPITSR